MCSTWFHWQIGGNYGTTKNSYAHLVKFLQVIPVEAKRQLRLGMIEVHTAGRGCSCRTSALFAGWSRTWGLCRGRGSTRSTWCSSEQDGLSVSIRYLAHSRKRQPTHTHSHSTCKIGDVTQYTKIGVTSASLVKLFIWLVSCVSILQTIIN